MCNAGANMKLDELKQMIGGFPDFPKPGILFRDIFPIFQDPKAVESLVDILVENVKQKVEKVDVIVGLESRGFLFGPLMAIKLGAAFVPIRKKGKLPGKCHKVSYSLEYGTDSFEAQCSSIKKDQCVVIVDDLIATGGTMAAASKLITDMGGDLKLCIVVIELNCLNGKSKLSHPFLSLLQY